MPDGSNPAAGPVNRTVRVRVGVGDYDVWFHNGSVMTVESVFYRAGAVVFPRSGISFDRSGSTVSKRVKSGGATWRAAVAEARRVMAEEPRKAERAAKRKAYRERRKAVRQSEAAAERSAPTRAEAPRPPAGTCFICGKPDAWGPARVLPPLVLVCSAGCAADPRFAGSAA